MQVPALQSWNVSISIAGSSQCTKMIFCHFTIWTYPIIVSNVDMIVSSFRVYSSSRIELLLDGEMNPMQRPLIESSIQPICVNTTVFAYSKLDTWVSSFCTGSYWLITPVITRLKDRKQSWLVPRYNYWSLHPLRNLWETVAPGTSSFPKQYNANPQPHFGFYCRAP